MNEGMQVAATREFNGITLRCYQEAGQVDPTDFWATREQIGQALGYADPTDAIAKIHKRNKERLDRFSGMDRLSTPEGGTQMTTIYNFKGLLEICRYSNQPVANQVIDVLWDIADEIRRTGSYGNRDLDPVNIRAAEVLQKLANMLPAKSEQREVVIEAIKLVTGIELPKKESAPKAAHTPRYWTVQQVASVMKWQPEAVMHRAEQLELTKESRYGYFEGDTWYFSKEGRQKFMEYVRAGIVKIEDGYEYYENGYKRIHWSFDPDAARV